MDVGSLLNLVFSTQLEEIKKQQILRDLAEPFDVEDIKWLPQTTRKVDGVQMGQAAAYADPRAYTDRLNKIVGPENWFAVTEVSFSPKFQKVFKGPYVQGQQREEVTREVAKCHATIYVGIRGLGLHSNVGEQWADDENACTAALAQALKRATVPFGLGRYLYSLPKNWYPVNSYGSGFTVDPQLPTWATPYPHCEDCKKKVYETILPNGKVIGPHEVAAIHQGKYKKTLCFPCGQKEKQKQAANQAVAAA
jgi:hypothetical protein